MFKIVSIALWSAQIAALCAAVVWGAGKMGFAPAQPYTAQIENAVGPVFGAVAAGAGQFGAGLAHTVQPQ